MCGGDGSQTGTTHAFSQAVKSGRQKQRKKETTNFCSPNRQRQLHSKTKEAIFPGGEFSQAGNFLMTHTTMTPRRGVATSIPMGAPGPRRGPAPSCRHSIYKHPACKHPADKLKTKKHTNTRWQGTRLPAIMLLLLHPAGRMKLCKLSSWPNCIGTYIIKKSD